MQWGPNGPLPPSSSTKMQTMRWRSKRIKAHCMKTSRIPLRSHNKSSFAMLHPNFMRTIEKDHGRLEIRKHWMIDDHEQLSYLDPTGKWQGLKAIGMVVAQRRIGASGLKRDPLLP